MSQRWELCLAGAQQRDKDGPSYRRFPNSTTYVCEIQEHLIRGRKTWRNDARGEAHEGTDGWTAFILIRTSHSSFGKMILELQMIISKWPRCIWKWNGFILKLNALIPEWKCLIWKGMWNTTERFITIQFNLEMELFRFKSELCHFRIIHDHWNGLQNWKLWLKT